MACMAGPVQEATPATSPAKTPTKAPATASVTVAARVSPRQAKTLGLMNPVEVDRRSVLVLDIPKTTPPKVLKAHFSLCGAVVRMTLLKNKATLAFSGTAYIEFADSVAAARALALDSSLILGQPIRVRPKPPKRTPPARATHRPLAVAAGPVALALRMTMLRPHAGTRPAPRSATRASMTWRASRPSMGTGGHTGSSSVTAARSMASQGRRGSRVFTQPPRPAKKLSEAGPLRSGNMTWKRGRASLGADALQPPLVRRRVVAETPAT
ncbi:hypothetical protein V8C86DRAFT_576048 [Haematococcus lacustris]